VRASFPPLNRPLGDVPPAVLDAASRASTDGFHLAMFIAAGLLIAGAVVNAVGIRDPKRQEP
jgi:hypothetical protein